MVIFHCYVSSPEGTRSTNGDEIQFASSAVRSWPPGEARDQRGPESFSGLRPWGYPNAKPPGWFHGKSPQSMDDKKGYPRDLGTQISERLIWMKYSSHWNGGNCDMR